MIRFQLIQAGLLALIYYFFGMLGMLSFTAAAILGFLFLETINYVEHYGLLRLKDEHGKYEHCKPHHSWNSNHIFSNLVLFHLERHSDHHTHPLRRYQSLRHFDDLPQLPNGYFGVYLLAYVPPLWFRFMDKRLLELNHVQGDLDKVNVSPGARAALFLKYGRDKMREPTIRDLKTL